MRWVPRLPKNSLVGKTVMLRFKHLMLVCFIMTNQSLTSTMIKDDQSTVPTSCRMVYFFLMIQRPAVCSFWNHQIVAVFFLGWSEKRVYSQLFPNYSHLIGIMISKTIGFRGTPFSDTPKLWLFFLWNHHRLLMNIISDPCPGFYRFLAEERYASPLEYRQQRIPQLQVVEDELWGLFWGDIMLFFALLENKLTSGGYIYIIYIGDIWERV